MSRKFYLEGVNNYYFNAGKMQNTVMDEAVRTPRDLRTCRARVWQEEWEPMPWDLCRRTVCMETRNQTYNRLDQRQRNNLEARLRRYRQYQVHYYGSPSEKETRK